MTASACSPTVLLCGASGFIGRHIAQALAQEGWQVRSPGRRSAPVLDFRRATAPEHWLTWLQGVDVVINAVGVLRDSTAQPMQLLHTAAPQALFAACAQAGVRRVLHISALGVAQGDTPYARSKRAADARLLALTEAGHLDGLVLRPSLVFGPGGASTHLFLRLARLPWLPLPRPVQQARVQPLAVWDLARAVARAAAQPQPTGVLNLAGPQALHMAEYIASLRQQINSRARQARIWSLPNAITQASARVGDALPFSPWCSQSLALLAHDNVASPQPLADLLGQPATAPADFWAGLQALAAKDS